MIQDGTAECWGAPYLGGDEAVAGPRQETWGQPVHQALQ